MYEERKDSFTLRDFIIQILFVGIFIFLLIWLFPMKSSVKKAFTPLYDQIFNNNVNDMKNAAVSYFTTPRLPQNVGQEVKMTLSEMLDKNIILPFVDSKGNQCDLIDSYVSMTKMSDEYILKINLKCGEQEDYLLVHLGCYDYCDGDVCEKEPEKVPETPVQQQSSKPSNPQPSNPQPSIPAKEYMYEYVKVTNGKWGDYGEWSAWTKNVITSTDYRQVETKVVEETTTKTDTVTTTEPIYEDRQVQTGTKKEAYTAYRDVPVYGQVQTGTTKEAYTAYRDVPVYGQVQTGTKQEAYTAYRDVPVYGQVQTGTKKVAYTAYKEEDVYKDVIVGYKDVPYTAYRDVPVNSGYDFDCTDTCKVVPKVTYKKEAYTAYKKEPIYEKQKTGTKKVPYTAYKEEPVYETKQTGTTKEAYTAYREVPVYETKQTGTKKEAYTAYREVPVYGQGQTGTTKEAYTAYREVPVYGTVKVKVGEKQVTKTVETPVTTKVTYYRSRTREYISGNIDTKWSKSQADATLISQGYSLTGNTCEVGVNCPQ